jgi:hypothetical protein
MSSGNVNFLAIAGRCLVFSPVVISLREEFVLTTLEMCSEHRSTLYVVVKLTGFISNAGKEPFCFIPTACR